MTCRSRVPREHSCGEEGKARLTWGDGWRGGEGAVRVVRRKERSRKFNRRKFHRGEHH